jgi:F-type H+-transporting ATPase subunit delta
MRAQLVARIYAATLLRIAVREEAVDEVDAGMSALAGVLEGEGTFARFLAAPQIASEDKKSVVARALGEALHPALVRFLDLIVDKRRESMLGEIAIAWRELLDQRANRMTAQLTTAVEIDEETRKSIAAALERSTGKAIILEHEIDPSLIGGVVVRFGDTVVDGSVRRRLALLRTRLKRAHVTSQYAPGG